MENGYKNIFILEFLYLAIIFGLTVLGVKLVFSYLWPIVLAAVIGTISRKLSYKFRKRIQININLLSVFTAVIFQLVIIISFGLFFYFFIRLLKNNFSNFPLIFDKLNFFIGKIEALFNSIFKDFSSEISENLSGIFYDYLIKLENKLVAAISDFLTNFVKSLPSLFFALIVTFVSSCYIAKDYEKLKKFVFELLSKKNISKIICVKEILTKNIFRIIKGYFILMLLTFFELTVAFIILKIKFAPLIAFLISLVDLLPVLGTGTILVPWGILEFAFENKTLGISLILVYILIIVIRNFAEPKIIGKQIGVNPLFTLIAIFLGYKLFGFLGLIILPLILIVVLEYYRKQLGNKIE